MINLLPNNVKQEISAARTNVTLLRYIAFSSFAVAFLALICGASYIFLVNSKGTGDSNNNVSASYSLVKQKANAISSSLTTAKFILDQQVSYSDVIMGIGTALPSGMIIEKLSLDSATIGSPMTIQIHARTSENVPKLKENFQRSTLFSDYSLKSVSTSQSDSSGYPVLVTINITVKKGVSQ